MTVTDVYGVHVMYVNERTATSPYTTLGIFRFNGNGSVLVENRGTDQNTTDANGKGGRVVFTCLFNLA